MSEEENTVEEEQVEEPAKETATEELKVQTEDLFKAINDLRKKIDHGKVVLSEYVPDYLVPECLKASYE